MPGGYTGKGRVVLFSNNPIYRWQNHAEFNLVFNAMMNWNDMGLRRPPGRRTTTQGGRRADRFCERFGTSRGRAVAWVGL